MAQNFSFKSYLALTKTGIVYFVLLSGGMGYFLSLPLGQGINWSHFLWTLATLYFFSAGSFALNQVQESSLDALMKRTRPRPIPSGQISRARAGFIALLLLVIGLYSAFQVHHHVVMLSLLTVLLYNYFYTQHWKRRWAFGAVPGAIPGALPVVIGYAANRVNFWTPECFYAFLLLFAWQMPHFWALALRFQEDYKDGGVPVLPTQIGVQRTNFHIGLYLFAYLSLAVSAPFFTSARFFYLIAVLPITFKLLWEFFLFASEFCTEVQRGKGNNWLRFFLWTNASVLVFLAAPVVDRWLQQS